MSKQALKSKPTGRNDHPLQYDLSDGKFKTADGLVFDPHNPIHQARWYHKAQALIKSDPVKAWNALGLTLAGIVHVTVQEATDFETGEPDRDNLKICFYQYPGDQPVYTDTYHREIEKGETPEEFERWVEEQILETRKKLESLLSEELFKRADVQRHIDKNPEVQAIIELAKRLLAA